MQHMTLKFEPVVYLYSDGYPYVERFYECRFKEYAPYIKSRPDVNMFDEHDFKIWLPSSSMMSPETEERTKNTAIWSVTIENKTTHQTLILAYSEPVKHELVQDDTQMLCEAKMRAPRLVQNQAAFKAGYYPSPEVIVDPFAELNGFHYLRFADPFGRYLSIHDNSFQHCFLHRLNMRD